MEMNYYIPFITALIPMVIGSIWYGPLFGNAWMKQLGFTKESLEGTNMFKIMSISYIMSVMISFALIQMVIHQMGAFSTLAGEPGFNEQTGAGFTFLQEFLGTYGDRFRTFKHGAFHGFLYGLFLVTPILTIIALFEKRSFKYIAINASYWMVTLALMGGVICEFV